MRSPAQPACSAAHQSRIDPKSHGCPAVRLHASLSGEWGRPQIAAFESSVDGYRWQLRWKDAECRDGRWRGFWGCQGSVLELVSSLTLQHERCGANPTEGHVICTGLALKPCRQYTVLRIEVYCTLLQHAFGTHFKYCPTRISLAWMATWLVRTVNSGAIASLLKYQANVDRTCRPATDRTSSVLCSYT